MKPFTDHPASVGETYSEHLTAATSFGFPMILAGFACVLHGLFPFLFEQTGSNLVRKLYERMVTKRADLARPDAPVGELDWCI